MKVSEIMTRDPKTAQLDSTLEEIAALMKDEDVGAIPIVDDDDELVGIVTDRDIVVRCVAEGKEASDTTVEDILTEELTTIEPDADVQQAARLMAEHLTSIERSLSNRRSVDPLHRLREAVIADSPASGPAIAARQPGAPVARRKRSKT